MIKPTPAKESTSDKESTQDKEPDEKRRIALDKMNQSKKLNFDYTKIDDSEEDDTESKENEVISLKRTSEETYKRSLKQIKRTLDFFLEDINDLINN